MSSAFPSAPVWFEYYCSPHNKFLISIKCHMNAFLLLVLCHKVKSSRRGKWSVNVPPTRWPREIRKQKHFSSKNSGGKKKAVICYIKKINIEAVLSNSVPLMCFVTLLLLPIIAHGLLLLLLIITLSFIWEIHSKMCLSGLETFSVYYSDLPESLYVMSLQIYTFRGGKKYFFIYINNTGRVGEKIIFPDGKRKRNYISVELEIRFKW